MEKVKSNLTLKEKILKGKNFKIKGNPSLIPFLIVIGILFFVYLFVSQSLSVVQLRYQNSNLQDQLLQAENDNKILTEKIEKITTDQYVEEEARNKLGMVKTGEVPIQIIQKEKPSQTNVKPIPSSEKVGVYMKDWYNKMKEWVQFSKQKKLGGK